MKFCKNKPAEIQALQFNNLNKMQDFCINLYQREVQSQSNMQTKKLKDVEQGNKLQKIEHIIRKEQNVLIVNEVYDSYRIKVNDFIEKMIQKANKQKTSHFLIIEAYQRFEKEPFYLCLFDHYSNLNKIRKGMQIKVLGEFDQENIIVLTAKSECTNTFILEPEQFITPSTLNSLGYCRRKAFIKEFFQNQAFGTTIEMLGGTIVHELFQNIIENPNKYQELFKEIQILEQQGQNIDEFDINYLPPVYMNVISELYKKYLQEFYSLEKMELQTALIHIFQKSVNAIKWIKLYVLEKQPIIIKQFKKEYEIYITQWIQNEQSIQSTHFGFKGFLDIVVEINYREKDQQFKSMIIPIELKTGHQSQSYEMQVQIYMTLIKQYYESECNIGILLYLNTLEHVVITCNKQQQNMLIFNRNLYISEIYQFEKQQNCYQTLPDIVDEIKSELDINRKCKKCDALSVCYGLHIITDQSQFHFQIPIYEEMKVQLQQKTKEYINKMLTELRQEEQAYLIPATNYSVKKITYDENGITFQLQSKGFFLQSYANKILHELNQNYYLKLFNIRTQKIAKFKFQGAKLFQGDQINVIDSQFDPDIALNDESYDYAIQIKIFSDNSQDQNNDQFFCVNDELIYKPFQKNLYKHQKHSIFELATNDVFFRRKKELIIFKMDPIFTPISELQEERKCALDILQHKFNQYISQEQIQSIQKIIQAEDYFLLSDNDPNRIILVHLLYLLSYINKKVIVFAETLEIIENIVQNFLFEFQNCTEWIAILSQDKGNQSLQNLIFNFKNYVNLKQIEDQLDKKKLFISTYDQCIDVLQSQQFDYCIIENASNIIEPLCVTCIMKSKVFILFGSDDERKSNIFQRLINKKNNENYVLHTQVQ